MTEQEFNREAERMAASIRREKIRGMRADLESAFLQADAKEVKVKGERLKVEIEQKKVSAIRYQLRSEEEKVKQAQYAFKGELVKTDIAYERLGMANDELKGVRTERILKQRAIAVQLEELELSVQQSVRELADRREILLLQGKM